MSDSEVPTEVELVFEVMPCNALRVAQDSTLQPHPCSYFREWGTYHSYDYDTDGPPPTPNVLQPIQYVGRAPLVPELLSGCRKAPILAVGINPNLPGWWPATRGSLNPWFDDYRQYAHYFRYRETAKLALSNADYKLYGGGPQDQPPSSTFQLNVPADANGLHNVNAQVVQQKMYLAYQSLLDDLAKTMALPANHSLVVGEDLAYANMIACPSAKWTTHADPKDPLLPIMTPAVRDGIVHECFSARTYFLRSLFQSLPTVILVFSQSTANAFIGELNGTFSAGDPKVNEPVTDLLNRQIVLKYGELPGGKIIDAIVIFAPHPTGDPTDWAKARPKVIEQLAAASAAKRFAYDPATGHLSRTHGSCVFCTMLGIGPCDYLAEIKPLGASPHSLVSDAKVKAEAAPDKTMQHNLLTKFMSRRRRDPDAWVAAEKAHDAAASKKD